MRRWVPALLSIGVTLLEGLSGGALAGQEPPCEPSVERRVLDTLTHAGASPFDCPATIGTGEAICATLDGSGDEFLAAWDARMANDVAGEVEDRTYRVEQTRLTLRLRGGVVAVTCEEAGERDGPAVKDPSSEEDVGRLAEAPVAPAPDPAAPVGDTLLRAVRALGAAPFECPEALRPAPPGAAICAFYDGPFDHVRDAWILPERFEPLTPWSEDGRARERRYAVGDGTVDVRLNNNALAVVYHVGGNE